MPDYDPLTISDEELKALPAAERGAVYKARAAARAGGAPPAPGAAAAPRPTAPAAQDTTGAAAGAGAAGPGADSESAAGATGSSRAVAAGASSAQVTGGDVSIAPAATGSPASTPAGATGAGAATPVASAGAAAPPAAKPAPKEPEKPKEPPFVADILRQVPEASWQWRHGYAEIKTPRDALLTAARSLKAQGFDYLSFITEIDWQDRYELVYHIYSYDYAAQPLGAILRCELPRDGMPSVASLTAVWPGAEFMEREAFEMLGIRFLGHPDLRRILLPDDFVGFPMRRDYETDYAYVTVKNLVHESD